MTIEISHTLAGDQRTVNVYALLQFLKHIVEERAFLAILNVLRKPIFSGFNAPSKVA